MAISYAWWASCVAPVRASSSARAERHRLGRKRIADTLFAATLLTHGVTELITCNPSDFRIFEGLTLIDPRSE
jgi:predicted nucleic acid-binding protein